MDENKPAPPIAFNIPANISPAEVGEYVAKLAQAKYQTPLASTTTASITAVAIQVDKEKLRCDKVTLQLGADWLPFKLNIDFVKK